MSGDLVPSSVASLCNHEKSRGSPTHCAFIFNMNGTGTEQGIQFWFHSFRNKSNTVQMGTTKYG